MNFFREIESTYKETVQIYREAKKNKDPDYPVIEDRMALMEEIRQYVRSYEWVKQDEAKEKIKVYLSSGFSYETLCKEFDTTYNAARVSVNWLSKQLQKKIGQNTLEHIRNYEIKEARSTFYVCSGKVKVKEYLLNDLIERLPDPEFGTYYLEECETELKVLSLMTKARLDDYMERVDIKKMAYLLYLLDGETREAEAFRPYLMAMLEGEMTAQEVIETEGTEASDVHYL